MKVQCISCGHEVNLNHSIFDDYEGPVKCFSCGSMMEVKTAQGKVFFVNPLPIFENNQSSALIEAWD